MKTVNLRSKNRNYWQAALFALLLTAWVSIPAWTLAVSADVMSSIDRFAMLTPPSGGTNPNGVAEWKLDDNGRREIEVNVSNIGLPAGTALQVVIDGNVIGQVFVDSFFHARMRLRTQDGQQVPTVNVGSTAQVRNGTTVLVAGVFANGTPSPTQTGTGTASPSPSQSGTGTASPSPSNSGTGTGTASPSPSQSGTATATNTATPSPSQSGTGTATPSPSQSGTGTASPSPSQSGTGSATPSPSQSGTGTSTPSPSQSGTGTGTPSPSQSGTASPSPSGSGTPNNESELFAGLSGPTLNGVLPTGFAEYEIHSSRTELEVRVRQVNLAIGTSLSVVVNGAIAGNMTIQSGGEAQLRLRSDNGQAVPVISVGFTIAVKNGDVTILDGTFGGSGTPSPSQTGTPGNTPSPSQTGTPNGTPSGTPTPFGRSFETHLLGGLMVPPVTTAATGEIKVTLSADETQATVFGEFHNLSSNQTGAVIETNIGTTVTIRDLGVVGGQNGHFAAATFAVTATQVQQLRAGLWSAVIKSVNNPNGEIRGSFRNHSRHSDFDGDGSHDFAVFRPSTGTWYSQSNSGFAAIQYGSPSDRVMSADFDGDGKTDAAVFRNVNGQGVWFINRSSDGGTTTVFWGLATDVPLRGDFNGDGRADIAVYRPSNGVWYIKTDDNNTARQPSHFGVAEDLPMPADMDGDGSDDIVVFRPSQGTWYWLRSSDDQFAAANFGLPGDVPVRGDFDGDGKADVSVYRPSNGTWYTLRSSDGGFRATQFGINGDVPVAGNYDEDGKTDIAVFRPSDGNWYVLRSSDGTFKALHFGQTGDVPAIAR